MVKGRAFFGTKPATVGNRLYVLCIGLETLRMGLLSAEPSRERLDTELPRKKDGCWRFLDAHPSGHRCGC